MLPAKKMPAALKILAAFGVFGAAAAVAPLPTAELVVGARLAGATAPPAHTDPFGQPAATGKLNQFKGFYTPRPLPPNAQLVYSSVWASWSAWSFCANHEQVRVRACNTVRGFNCLGLNRESKPCGFDGDAPLTPQTPTSGSAIGDAAGRDYDSVDPWAEDRREALRQLNAGSGPDTPPGVKTAGASKPAADDFARQRSAGRTFQSHRKSYGGGVGPQAPPIRPPASSNDEGPGQAPSLTPELLFGSRIEPADSPIVSDVPPADSLSVISATIASSHDGDGKHSDDQRTATVSRPLVPADTILATGDDASSRQLFAESKGVQPQPLTQVHEQLTPIAAPTGKPSENGGHRTTIVEPPQPPPVPPAAVAAGDAGFEKNLLHSGEVVFPKDERISLETARAFEWMLASMSRAADAELLIDAEQKKSKQQRHRNTQHSGEARLPRRKATLHSGEFNPHPNLVKLAASNDVRRKEPARAFASRQWAPPANKIDAIATEDAKQNGVDSVKIRPTKPDVLSDASAEKLERDLIKIQSVMRQIEGELEALKRAEGALDAQQQKRQQLDDRLVQQKQQQKQQQSRRSGAVQARVQPLTKQPPLEIDLVPTVGPLPSSSGASSATTVRQEVLLVAAGFGNPVSVAEWSDWRPWAECFCSRQVRTRVCKYDPVASSRGCAGRSYESRHCSSPLDRCPTARGNGGSPSPPPSDEQLNATTAKFYTLAPPRADRPPAGAAFQPRPLAFAALAVSAGRR